MALSMPDAVSTVRGGVLPARGRERHGLGDDAAELGEIDEPRHFPGVPEGAGRHEDGVAQREPAEPHRQVDHRAGPRKVAVLCGLSALRV